MDFNTYRDHPALNISSLCKFADSEKAFFDYVNNPDWYESKEPQTFGVATHCALYEPEIFKNTYVVSDATRQSNKGKAELAEIEASGKLRIKTKELAKIERIQNAVREHPLARELFDSSTNKYEESIFFKIGDRDCKMRLDGIDVENGVITDLKTTSSPTLKGFERDCIKYAYFAKAAFYCHGAKIKYGKRFDFKHIIVGSSAPFPVGVIQLSDDARDFGDARWQGWMRQLERCEQSGVWRDIFDGMLEWSHPPAWAEDLV